MSITQLVNGIKNIVRKKDVLYIYVDGASRGNPGPAACAYIFVKNNEEIIDKKAEYIGKTTNNVAEYKAIILALNDGLKYTRKKVRVFSDSELVINQLNKEYRIKKDHLRELVIKIEKLIPLFESVEFLHVRRTNKFIKIVDKLCNNCLNENM